MNTTLFDALSLQATEFIATTPLYKGAVFRDPDTEAASFGLIAVHPMEWELQIDLDTEEDFERFVKRYIMLEKYISCYYEEKPSKSGLPHRHITVTMNDVTCESHWKRIALQAALGSDGNREMFNCIRTLNGDSAPSVFFELPTV